MAVIRAVILTLCLLLTGCYATGEYAWWDVASGKLGKPYQDELGAYYLVRDYQGNRYAVRGGSPSPTPANPYVYQPGSSSWTRLYQWSIYRPYIFPKCPRN